ncbi:MAG: hypothetical protein HY548_09985 [Elusimicrobia bacterium]|nr:hypothetical protein [Elusimicrobiota bacterium]
MKSNILLPIVGLDVSKPGEFVDPQSTPNAQNMYITRNVLAKRLGTTALGSSLAERVMALSELQIGALTYVLRVGLTKVELLDKNAGTWSDVSHAVLTGTTQDRFDFAYPLLSGAKIMTMTNGIDAIRKYTGTGNTAALGGSPPLAKYMVAFGDYLVLAYITSGGNTYAGRVQWPDTGDPETWTGGNSGSTDLVDDGRDITGLGIFGDFVTIHKETAIYLGYLVSTSEVFRFDRKNTGVGTVSFATIKNLPTGEQIFLARDGIRIFNGIAAPPIGGRIMDELRESMSPQHIDKCWSVIVHDLDEYWVGIPIGSQTTPDTVYKYNYKTDRCYKDTRSGITACSTYQKTSQLTWADKTGTWNSDTTRWNDVNYLSLAPTVLMGNSSGVTTERSALYNDNGSAVDAYWESKDLEYEDEPGRLMRWVGLKVWAKGSAVTVAYSTDEGGTWTDITTLMLSSSYPTDSSPLTAYLDVVSSRLRLRFRNNTASESFTLKKFVVEAKPRELR